VNVGRAGIAKAIHERCGLPFRKIYQAIGMIIEQITSDLVNDQVVTVRRFGTLSPHVRRAHLAHNVSSGVVRKLSSKRSVKFHPHESFSGLIQERQERFRQRPEDNS
jgi:nucleoid DNA-binding protein